MLLFFCFKIHAQKNSLQDYVIFYKSFKIQIKNFKKASNLERLHLRSTLLFFRLFVEHFRIFVNNELNYFLNLTMHKIEEKTVKRDKIIIKINLA